jgi:carboxypeptidase Taq
MDSNKTYSQLHEISKNNAVMSTIHMLLEWDQQTYMPHSAIAIRSLQMQAMSSLVHKLNTSSKFSKVLSQLIDLKTGEILGDKLTPPQSAALHEWRRDYLQLIKLPAPFVKKFSQTVSQAAHAWGAAKKHNAFKDFAPFLEKIITLSRKKADYLGFQNHPYDALLDLYEPGMTTHYLTELFSRLKLSLTSLLKTIKTAPEASRDFLYGFFEPSKQNDFGHRLLKTMGFDANSSRLDESNHPFCMGMHPLDTRLTTRIHPDYLMSNIFAVIHEGGHGLYNMGLPVEQFGSPLGTHISMALDESQSRMWETIVGHSLPFWKHFYPLLQEQFPDKLRTIPLNDFYRAINTIKPSLIRIESDEVTYSLHIIVRFEIEKMLIEGTLKVKEIPEIWQSKMIEYLGISPTNDADGCLQDIHWSIGAIGYFPTYTLGNLYAAQFFQKFEQTHPHWKEKMEKGDLSVLRNWLHENIHRYGRQYTPDEIAVKITGKTVNEEAYLSYLKNKYKTLYHLEKLS